MKVKRKVAYRGHVFTVEEWINPGTGSEFARVVAHDAVGVVALTKRGNILIERQWRHSLDKHLYEIPAGHIDAGEDPEHAARRELEEETGYRAGKLTHMLNMYGAPGSYTQLMHIYLAENLRKTRENREKDEMITVAEVSFGKALGMIRSNRIEDGKTILSILYYLRFFKK